MNGMDLDRLTRVFIQLLIDAGIPQKEAFKTIIDLLNSKY
jgi:hypothetical protein